MLNIKLMFTKHIQIAALIVAVAVPSARGASGGTNIGWALANQPNVMNPYTASPNYSYNSFGQGVTILHEAVGFYSVVFPGLVDSRFSNPQVTANNSTGYCVSVGSSYYALLGARSFDVACYDTSGNLANSEFTLLMQRRWGIAGNVDHAFAFLWAINANATSTYTPTPDTQYNSLGGANTVTRNGVGSYTALFPGLTRTGGQVQVTAFYGGARCAVKDWSSKTLGTLVDVLCVDKTGAPSNSEFFLAYSIGEPLGFYGLGAAHGAYAWATKPESTKPYSTVSTYSFNNFGTGALKAQKTGTGTYSVTIPGTITYSKSVALVTAVGATSNYCNLAGWTHQTINVACYAQGGVPTDSQFAVTFQTAP